MRLITFLTALLTFHLLPADEKPLVHLVSYSRHLLPGVGIIPYERIQKDFKLQTYYDLYRYVHAFK